MDVALNAAQWVVGRALAPITDGMLEAWGNSNNLGLNVEALGTELLLVKATLETASRKQISGQAMEKLLRKLRESAHCAEDLLDELDYFRIHDELHGTYNAADQHAKGGVHDLALNARHTAKAVLGLSSAVTPAEPGQVVQDARQQVACWAWPRARQRSRGNSSSSTSNPNQSDHEVRGCIPKLGKFLPCSSSPHEDNSSDQSTLCDAPQRKHAEGTPMLGFNRVDISERMKHIVGQMQPVRREFTNILQSCDRITVPNIAQSRLITTGRSIEPKLYGRDHIMNSIIHDMTKGKYHRKHLTVLPIVGPGGIGKTTMIQHIYQNKEVQSHFQVVIWVCVSLSFNLSKLLEDIKKDIPRVEGEKDGTAEDLIEQRLKSKRLLLVLDDIWECSNEDDWERLFLPLKKSQEKGSMIIVTTRFPAIAKMVGTIDHSIELEGIETKYFRVLFHAFVFGDDQHRSDDNFLLETGDKIMVKLKGSPLAAKTVGRLLRKDLNLRHWRRVLESKQWEKLIGANDIMPALKLSYDYLPFQLQQCFSYAALFPEDFRLTSSHLINLWIGLDILQSDAQNRSFEDIGLSILNDLVAHGFFREEETDGCPYFVMHDLLHDLALQVACHDCINLHRSNVGLIQIQPSIRHLSIIIDDVGADNAASRENFKSQLTKLKTRLKVKHLHTLMVFGEMDESFAKVLCDLFSEANALRVLRLVNMPFSVECILPNFSGLLHLRYLCLGTKYRMEMHLSPAISRFYHLRILDLRSWYRCRNLPKDFSNLAKLHHFYTPKDELHSEIHNVGKLIHLEELKVYRVNKESEGFEPMQLEPLTDLRELGIYNLENIHTKEEAAKAKLIEKNYLERLTLVWDNERSNTEPDVEEAVLESLQPHGYLQELCIKGHKGPSCPTWLGDKLSAVEALESLHLVSVSWQCLPSLGKMWGLRNVKLEHIAAIEEFVIEQSFCRLIRLELIGLGSFQKWVPSQGVHMLPLLQILKVIDCPKLMELPFPNHNVYPKPDQDWNTDWFPNLQELEIWRCPEILFVPRIPWTESLRHVNIRGVKVLETFEYSKSSVGLEIVGKDDLQSLDQVLAFNNLTGLEKLMLEKCPPLESKHLLMLTSLKTLVVESSHGLAGPLEGEGDVEWQHSVECLVVTKLHGASGKELTELLTHLPRLSKLIIEKCENNHLLSPGSFSYCLFPSSLQDLRLNGVEGLGTLEPLSNLTNLTRLDLFHCGEDLRCKGLEPLLTAGGQLRELEVRFSPRFFAGWDPNPRRVLQLHGGGEEQLVSPSSSSKLQKLWTDEAMGLLSAPICSLLSSSLTELHLYGTCRVMERFTKEQENAFHLLASLQQLQFLGFDELQHLPAGLHKLTNLKRLEVCYCPGVRSLPKDGLPKSLQELDVRSCGNEELKQQCRELVGTIPKIIIA
jgi:hypothetical protein